MTIMMVITKQSYSMVRPIGDILICAMTRFGCQTLQKHKNSYLFPFYPRTPIAYRLTLSDYCVIIAVQNDHDMRTLEENYELLEKLVDEEMIYLAPEYDFGRVCRLLGAPRAEMDSLLECELGLDGDALFASLRASLPGRLERKYGLKCFFQEV